MSQYLAVKNKGGCVPQKATRVLRRLAKFAKTATNLYAVFHKSGYMGKILIKNRYRKVTHANFENILGNRCRRWLQGICDGINRPSRVIVSDG